jgi:quinol monooxygenase YgiN
MYGTVARMTVKGENVGPLRDLMARQMRERTVPGYVASYLLRENNADTTWLFVIFEDRASYEANADDPAMDAQYREYRALLDADPEWHDGEIETDAAR